MLKRTHEAALGNPVQIGTDAHTNGYQAGMTNLVGNQGYLPHPLSRDMMPHSSIAINPMAVPAGSGAGIPNPRLEQIGGLAIEYKTVFAANSGDYEAMLGSNGVAPLTPSNSMAFYITKIRVNSHMPEQTPEGGRTRQGTIQREQRVGRLSSYGIGFQMPLRAYMDIDGPMYLRMMIEQMSLGMVDFLILMVYNMLLNAYDYGLQQYVDLVKRSNVRTALNYVDWLERDNFFLGAMQRLDHPIETLTNYIREKQRLAGGVESDVLVVNHKLGPFVREIRQYTEFFRAGASGPATVTADPDTALRARLQLDVHVVRTHVIDDENEFDFMSGIRRYGEYVPMVTKFTPSESQPYSTRWLDTWLLCARTDKWMRVTLRDALWHSGRWDATTGELIDINSLIDIDAGAATYDPFHRVNPQTNKLEPVKTFGELPHISTDFLRNLKKSDISKDAEAALKGAFATLRRYAREIRSKEHDEELMDLIAPIGSNSLFTGGAKKSFDAFAYIASSGGMRFFAELSNTADADTIGEAIAAVDAVFTQKETANTIIDLAIGANYPRVLIRRGTADGMKPGSGARTAINLASPISIGNALGVSNSARAAVESALTGAWTVGASGVRAAGDVSTAALVRMGLVRHVGGQLDVSSSDPSAVAAINLVHNFGYTNTTDATGVHATEQMRGYVLAGMQNLALTGSAPDVSARIGAYVGWLTERGVVPAGGMSGPMRAPVSTEQVAAFPGALREFANSDVGKTVFGDQRQLSAAMRSIGAAAAALTPANVAAKIGTARIGASAVPLDTDFVDKDTPSRYVITPLQYTEKQLKSYLAYVDSGAKPSVVKFQDPARPGEVLSIDDIRQIVNSGSDSRLRSDYASMTSLAHESLRKLRELERQAPNPVTVAYAAEFLAKPLTWDSIEEMLATDTPIPLTPILMRWRAELTTAGLIATKRRSAITAYGYPRTASDFDGALQTMRLNSFFQAGAFIVEDKGTYHARDILITGITRNGMNVDFATREGMMQEHEHGFQNAPAGSIVSILEPHFDIDRPLPAISAYGSWERAGLGVAASLGDLTQLHFHSVDWMRKYWGVRPVARPLTGPLSHLNGDFLLMWLGGCRRFNPVRAAPGDIERGCGPVASNFFYDEGMFTAWRNGTAYPSQSQTRTVVS